MSKKISISINNQNCKINVGLTLEELIISKEMCRDNVATAVNNTFIPKSDRSKHILQNTDSVIIFSAITGG